MRRITVSLPDELAALVSREAQRTHASISAATCDALAAHLGLTSAGERPLPFAAIGRSGHASVARDMESLLAAEWRGDDRRR